MDSAKFLIKNAARRLSDAVMLWTCILDFSAALSAFRLSIQSCDSTFQLYWGHISIKLSTVGYGLQNPCSRRTMSCKAFTFTKKMSRYIFGMVSAGRMDSLNRLQHSSISRGWSNSQLSPASRLGPAKFISYDSWEFPPLFANPNDTFCWILAANHCKHSKVIPPSVYNLWRMKKYLRRRCRHEELLVSARTASSIDSREIIKLGGMVSKWQFMSRWKIACCANWRAYRCSFLYWPWTYCALETYQSVPLSASVPAMWIARLFVVVIVQLGFWISG